MEEKYVSEAVIRRLPRYYRYLGELIDEGVDHISSQELSERMSVTASQIRQDLNNFGGFGQQGYGYNVINLRDSIGKILGLDKQYNIIMIGGGNLGRAIANYGNFRKKGFNFIAIFDRNKDIVGTRINDIDVYSLDDLESFVLKNKVDIAALAIPKNVSKEIASKLVNLGVKAFWNFSHTELSLGDDVLVENVHLSESLMSLSYRISHK